MKKRMSLPGRNKCLLPIFNLLKRFFKTIHMPDKTALHQPPEIPQPNPSPEIRPDYQPETPIYPDQDPGTVPPKLPDNPWPEKKPEPPSQPATRPK
jgi:hypothetical protein